MISILVVVYVYHNVGIYSYAIMLTMGVIILEHPTSGIVLKLFQPAKVKFVKIRPSFVGGMSSQLVRPNLTRRTMQLNARVADNFMNIEILFLPLIL